MSVTAIGILDGGTFAAQSSASTRVIEDSAREPNSARSAFSDERAVSMLESL